MNAATRYKVKRYIALFFLMWVLFNHSVRMFSGPTVPASLDGPPEAFPKNPEEALSKVNAVRLMMGKKFYGLEKYCPQAIAGFCVVSIDTFAIALGLSSKT